MKSPDIADVLTILVAAGWSKRDIVDALLSVSRLSPYQLEREVNEVAYRLEDMRRHNRSLLAHSYRAPAKKGSMDQYSDLYIKVREILVDDLGFSNEQIVTFLSQKLGGDSDFIPPLSKKSLANWLDRLAAHYSPSEILHAASVIRDGFRKGQALDWGVRSEN